jgi:hypothetical protein
VLTKLFHEKNIFFVVCVKETKFGAKKVVAQAFFYLSTQDINNVGLPQNLAHAHRIWICTSVIFLFVIFRRLKIFPYVKLNFRLSEHNISPTMLPPVRTQ